MFSTIYGCGSVTKNGEGLGTLIVWMTYGRCEVDVREGGIHIQINVLDSVTWQDPRCSQDHEHSAWLVRNLFIVHILVVRYSPLYREQNLMTNVGMSTHSPFFAALLHPRIVLNVNWRTKTGKAWEWDLSFPCTWHIQVYAYCLLSLQWCKLLHLLACCQHRLIM